MNRCRALGVAVGVRTGLVLGLFWLWATIGLGKRDVGGRVVVWIAWSIVVMTVSVRAGGSGGVAARRRGGPPV